MEYTAKDLVAIDEEIARLEAKRGEILNALRIGDGSDVKKLSADQKALFEFIAENPGASRRQLEDAFSELSSNEVTNLLLALVKRRRIVQNRGTRKNPAYYISASVIEGQLR